VQSASRGTLQRGCENPRDHVHPIATMTNHQVPARPGRGFFTPQWSQSIPRHQEQSVTSTRTEISPSPTTPFSRRPVSACAAQVPMGASPDGVRHRVQTSRPAKALSDDRADGVGWALTPRAASCSSSSRSRSQPRSPWFGSKRSSPGNWRDHHLRECRLRGPGLMPHLLSWKSG
jgi:hypothetical protein